MFNSPIIPSISCSRQVVSSNAASLDWVSGDFRPVKPIETVMIFRVTISHWEESLQSVSDFIFSKHCGCTPRGVRDVKRLEIL